MLRGSLRVGTLLGVPLYIHWTFLLLLAWLMAGPLFAGAENALIASLTTGGLILAVFACVVLHELGHSLAARRYGIKTRDITLLPIGGIASLERMPERPGQELVVAVAGPLVNVGIAAVLIPAALAMYGPEAFTGTPGEQQRPAGVALYERNFLATLGSINVFLVVFNMIPALPMDGGRVLRALLAMVMDRSRATAAAAAVGQVFAVLFAIVGIFTGHILLIVIALFVFLGAAAEMHGEQFRSALAGLRAGLAMQTRFRVLRASDTLRHAAEELLAGSQQDFPVLADDAAADDDARALVGMLTREDLVRAIASGAGQNMETPVSSVMRPVCATATEEEDLRAVLERARDAASPDGFSGGCPVIPVVRGSERAGGPGARIVGIITPDNVNELVMLRAASQAGARPTPPAADPARVARSRGAGVG